MDTKSQKKIFEQLLDHGVFDYGATIPGNVLLKKFGFDLISDAEFEQWQEDGVTFAEVKRIIEDQDIREMALVDKIREWLIADGRIIKRRGANYYIPLPSENLTIARQYFEKGIRKNRRGEALIKNTPTTEAKNTDQTQSRMAVADRIMRQNIDRI